MTPQPCKSTLEDLYARTGRELIELFARFPRAADWQDPDAYQYCAAEHGRLTSRQYLHPSAISAFFSPTTP